MEAIQDTATRQHDECEACVERDLMIAALHQQVDLLYTVNQRLRQRIAETIRVLGTEVQTR